MNSTLQRYIKPILFCTCILFSFVLSAQCPPNIGFEKGNFDNWECSMGTISGSDGSISVNVTGPVSTAHLIIDKVANTVLDEYGNFPRLCPNGSNYSVKLGIGSVMPTGRKAERVSYTFTIPADDDNYSIVYNYAVVFQNPANHADWEQPKFSADVYDVTTNTYIGCSSFQYTASAGLPGFKVSPKGDSILYKPWTPVTIKLSGYAGRTIRIEFTANDCSRGGHFGYAYVDVNQNCSSPISGNIQCVKDTAQTLTAPFGFASYRWFTGDFSQQLGSELKMLFDPTPKPGSVFAVEVTPYPGQGCVDTVYTTIKFSADTVKLNIPNSMVETCISTGVNLTDPSITAGSSSNLQFEYYTDPQLLNYLASPSLINTSGTYYIKAMNDSGCVASQPVKIIVDDFPDFTLKSGSGIQPVTRPNSIDLGSLVTSTTGNVTFSFWLDTLCTKPVPDPKAISKTGVYYLKATTPGGCFTVKSVHVVVNEPTITPPNAFSPNGDGVNDTWQIPTLSSLYPDCIVQIYNRLGQLLYTSLPGYPTPWDGKYKGQDLPVSTYYFVIKLSDELRSIGGSISIIR